MNEPGFDQYAEKYDRVLADTIPEALSEDGYFAEYKIALVAARMSNKMPGPILDFGCGGGRSLLYRDQYFPSAEL